MVLAVRMQKRVLFFTNLFSGNKIYYFLDFVVPAVLAFVFNVLVDRHVNPQQTLKIITFFYVINISSRLPFALIDKSVTRGLATGSMKKLPLLNIFVSVAISLFVLKLFKLPEGIAFFQLAVITLLFVIINLLRSITIGLDRPTERMLYGVIIPTLKFFVLFSYINFQFDFFNAVFLVSIFLSFFFAAILLRYPFEFKFQIENFDWRYLVIMTSMFVNLYFDKLLISEYIETVQASNYLLLWTPLSFFGALYMITNNSYTRTIARDNEPSRSMLIQYKSIRLLTVATMLIFVAVISFNQIDLFNLTFMKTEVTLILISIMISIYAGPLGLYMQLKNKMNGDVIFGICISSIYLGTLFLLRHHMTTQLAALLTVLYALFRNFGQYIILLISTNGFFQLSNFTVVFILGFIAIFIYLFQAVNIFIILTISLLCYEAFFAKISRQE